MEEKLLYTLEKLLNKHNRFTETTAVEILNEIKSTNKTYGEVKRTINKLEQSTIYEYQDKYIPLMKKIKELLEREMNGLLVENRS